MKQWIVFIEDGYTRLMSPNGEIFEDELSGVIESSCVDREGKPSKMAYYKAEFLVKLASNKEEALKLVNAQEVSK